MSENLFEISTLDRFTINDILKLNNNKGDEALDYTLQYLFYALSTGSLCIDLNADSYLNRNFFLSAQFMDNYNAGVYNNVISNDNSSFKPLILRKSAYALYLYFYRYYNSERKFETLIKEKIALKKDMIISEKILDEILDETEEKSALNNDKKLAIYLALTGKFLIITGGPGTGKTFTAAKIVKYFIENFKNINKKNPVIKLTAPTGKAAKRLGEQLSKEYENQSEEMLNGETIHRLLKYKGDSGKFTFNCDNKIPADLIIADEVSMIDINLFSSLMEAVSDETTLIVIGDKDQLPSVDAGAVLKDLLHDDFSPSFSKKILDKLKISGDFNEKGFLTDQVVELKSQHRTSENVSKIASEINKGNDGITDQIKKLKVSDLSDNTLNDDLYFIDIDDINNYKNFLYYYFNRYYNNREYKKLPDLFVKGEKTFNELFIKNSESKILTILKEGFYGSTGINDFLLQVYKKDDNSISGIPIMITSNDYSLNLFNGESGIICLDKFDMLKAYFPAENEDGFRSFSLNFLPSYLTSFSITVHKSQGSQYRDVFLVLPNDIDNPLLTREIIYTAITRAEKKVFIVGKIDVLKKAIKGKIIRFSGINDFKEE